MSSPIVIAIVDSLDSFSLKDTLVTFAPTNTAFNDTVTIVDSVTVEADGFINIPLEGLGLSDSVALILGLGVCLRELTYSSGGQAVNCSDSIGDPPPLAPISDNLDAVVAGINLALNEAIDLSDQLDVPATITLGLSDTLALSDTQAFLVPGVIGLADSLSLSDQLNTFAPYNILITDGLTLSDNISLSGNGIPITFSVADTLSLTDNLAYVATCLVGVSDTIVVITDAIQVHGFDLLNLSDSLSFTDHVALAAPLNGLEVSDNILLTDDIDLSYGLLFGGLSDELILVDAINISLIVVDPQVSDSYTLSDSIQLHLDVAQLGFVDLINLSDAVGFNLATSLTRSVSDLLDLQDNVNLAQFTDFIDYVRRYLNDVPSNSNVGS